MCISSDVCILGDKSNRMEVTGMMTEEQKELKKELEELEIDPFLIDLIIKFYPVTIKTFLNRIREGVIT